MKGKLGLLYGFLFGALLPLIPYGILYAIVDANDKEMTSSLTSAFNRSYDYFGRGVILAMFGYVVYIIINFEL